MTITSCIDLIGKTNYQLYCSILEADSSVHDELSNLLEAQQKISQLDYQFLGREQLQEQLFLVYERANKKALKAKNKGQLKLWLTWEKIVDILDLACECLEKDPNDDSYLIY